MKRKLLVGGIVAGKVIRHENFGFFVEVHEEPHLGLVEIVHIVSPDHRPLTRLDFPVIGSEYNFEILGYREDNNQVYLKWPMPNWAID